MDGNNVSAIPTQTTPAQGPPLRAPTAAERKIIDDAEKTRIDILTGHSLIQQLVQGIHGWLVAHAADFGFKPIPTEAWHWEHHP